MAFESEYIDIALDAVHSTAQDMKDAGARFVQVHAVATEDAVDLYYTFDMEGRLTNYKVAGIRESDAVPSITDLFLAAFVFENEARELFGVDMRDVAIDFDGSMYTLAEPEPMTFISPEMAKAKEKVRKAAAAKLTKAAKQAEDSKDPKPDADEAAMEAKLAGMDPEKAAKIRAALKAKAAKSASEGKKA